MQFENKTVFVTGTNRGIGKGLVKALLERGVNKIYATARDASQAPGFGDSRVETMALDICDPDRVLAVAQEAADTDLLINNAGVAGYESILTGPMAIVERDMATNYFGTLSMMRAFIPVLETKDEPAIANVVSIAAFVNFPFLGGYSASKAAMFSLTQGARIELASKGIAVHSINPGPIDTDMAKDFDGDTTSVEVAVNGILDALSAGQADIFPDPGGRAMFDTWTKHYRDLEQMVSEMVEASK